MSQEQLVHRVGLFGHYGNQNLGDEAIIQASIQNLRERIPDLEFIGFCLNPSDTRQRHGITAFPIRNTGKVSKSQQDNGDRVQSVSGRQNGSSLFSKMREQIPFPLKISPSITGFIKKLAGIRGETRFMRSMKSPLQRLDALLICGSNQFEDSFGGPWAFPYTLMKWVALAKSVGTPVYFVSVGASPMRYELSKWMLRYTLAEAEYLSFRDEGSQKLIEESVSDTRGRVYPDLANSLKRLPQDVRVDGSSLLHIAINPMPVSNGRYWYKNDPRTYRSYLSNLANFINYLNGEHHHVTLYNNHPADQLAIRGVVDLLQKRGIDPGTVELRQNETVPDLINTIAAADIVVATRFHSTVLPLRLGIPVMGICYERKSRELLEEMGLSAFSVDVYNFSYEDMIQKFEALLSRLGELKKSVHTNYCRYTASMDEQWDEIACLISNSTANEI